MLIRSQDKRKIINLNNIDYIYCQEIIKAIEHTYYIMYNSIWLGKYSSEEEAIKVLDDICEQYERAEKTDYVSIGYVGNVVFNMPTKEDK
jgi:hypothetical protein